MQAKVPDFRIGGRVSHKHFGVGTVTDARGGIVVVRFADTERHFVSQIAPLASLEGGEAKLRGEVVSLDEWRAKRNGPRASEPAPAVRAYIDGGCEPNPGFAVWGAFVEYPEETHELTGFERNSTNQRAEILAAIGVLESLGEPSQVELLTDSQYLVNCATGAWKRKANRDLFKRLDDAIEAGPHAITYSWVRGHAGNAGNEAAHALVESVLESHKGGSGA